MYHRQMHSWNASAMCACAQVRLRPCEMHYLMRCMGDEVQVQLSLQKMQPQRKCVQWLDIAPCTGSQNHKHTSSHAVAQL